MNEKKFRLGDKDVLYIYNEREVRPRTINIQRIAEVPQKSKTVRLENYSYRQFKKIVLSFHPFF